MGSSESHREGMESTEYQHEEALETGRLPESERFENNQIIGDDVEQRLQQGFVAGGP